MAEEPTYRIYDGVQANRIEVRFCYIQTITANSDLFVYAPMKASNES